MVVRVFKYNVFCLIYLFFCCGLLNLHSQVSSPSQPTRSIAVANPLFLKPFAPKFYEKILEEFEKLKKRENEEKIVCVSCAQNSELAPTLLRYLNYIVKKLIKKTSLKMPNIFIYLGGGKEGYNASMQTSTYRAVVTTTRGVSSVSTEIVHNEYRLTLGKELIELFFWNTNNKTCLEAVIAHEIGHAVNNHSAPSKLNEFAADKTAVSLLDNPYDLVKAIDMLTLSGHLFNNLTTLASQSLQDHVHYLVRVLTSALIFEIPDLGKLGDSPSHSNFSYAVNMALAPVLEPKALQRKNINAATVVIDAYNQLKTICTTPEKIVQESDQVAALKGKILDELTNRYFSPIEHPDPKSRRDNIRKCILEKLGGKA